MTTTATASTPVDARRAVFVTTHWSVVLAAGLSEAAARQAVHRLRRRFQAVFHEEILETVATPADAEAETRHLLAALAG